MFGLFKKKPPTMLDAFIHLAYGPNPPAKSADLERSITIAHEDLLFERVPLFKVKQKAAELIEGPIPYSTHDLAVSTALGFFKSSEYVPALQECQIPARLRVVNWAKDGKVVKPLAQSFEEVLYKLYKPRPSEARERPMASQQPSSGPPNRPTANEEAEKQIISLIEQLLTAQLMLKYEHPREAFSTLTTNKLAAGYVFGFHGSCFQTFGRFDPNNPKSDLSEIRNSYRTIFGVEAGTALFEMSIASQSNSEFQIGRLSGGEEYIEFIQKKSPPLGLQRILLLGFDAAAVSRTLDKDRTQSSEATNQGRDKPEQEPADNAMRLVHTYAALLQAHPHHIIDASWLPADKPTMIEIFKLLLSGPNEKIRKSAEDWWCLLSHFQPGVGAVPIDIEISKDNPTVKEWRERKERVEKWMEIGIVESEKYEREIEFFRQQRRI